MLDNNLEDRIRRLEDRVLKIRLLPTSLDNVTFWISFLLIAGAGYAGHRGLGLPNHPYQIALAVMAVLVAYHRGWVLKPSHFYHWILLPLNVFVLSMTFRLVLGGGIRNPLFWIRVPNLVSQKAEGKWFPEMSLAWQATSFAEWTLDFTVIQTFLLIMVLIGGLFELELFVSLVLFLLILISIPIFASFEWAWVFPALLLATLSWYFQSQGVRSTASSRLQTE